MSDPMKEVLDIIMSGPKTVGDIIREYLPEYLRKHGYDGLCNPCPECGCGIDDLFPCTDGPTFDCEVAYRHECDKCIKSIDPDADDDGCELYEKGGGCYCPDRQVKP